MGVTPAGTCTSFVYSYTNSAWGDLLTNSRGFNITYDEIGNPTSYYNGIEYTFTWEGRRLKTASHGSYGYTFEYDDEGMRTYKERNGIKTYYYYDGDRLIAEQRSTCLFIFVYDASGSVVGYQYRENSYAAGVWDTFWYEKNLQGDVVAVYNGSGVKLVSYVYDAYGNFTETTMNGGHRGGAYYNPFRYRGYYYDTELMLYYLGARYYDSMTGRFVSSDTSSVLTATPTALTDKNLYAYCDNNPVTRGDNGGEFWETFLDVISLGASIVEVCINPTDPMAWAGLVGDAIDLIPFVTGVGEATRAVKTIDKVADTVQIAKAVDFTDDAADIVKTLDRSSGFTKSTASAGRKIHAGYKATDNFSSIGKEYRRINGIRPDYIDFDTRTIYELKPMNPRGVRSGIRQLQKYNKALGGGFNLRLELY